MTTRYSTREAPPEAAAEPVRSRLFSVLAGLASLAVFLQSVWAGMIIREGEDFNDTWVTVHDWGARIAFFLALAATIVAVVRLSARRDLVIGAAAMTVLIFVESYIGGLIGDKASAIAVHIPVGFATMALAVWLPLRSVRGHRRAGLT
jgi:heme A synthase